MLADTMHEHVNGVNCTKAPISYCALRWGRTAFSKKRLSGDSVTGRLLYLQSTSALKASTGIERENEERDGTAAGTVAARVLWVEHYFGKQT